MNGDNVSVLDPQIVTNNTVETSAAVIKIIVREDNQDGVLSLLSTNQDGIAAEELERLHGVIGESDDGVVIIDGVGYPVFPMSVKVPLRLDGKAFGREGHTSTGLASFSF